MKTYLKIVLLLTFCGIALSQDQQIKKIVDDCLAANNASEQDFQDLGMGKLLENKVGENMKCAVKCFTDKNGFLDPATGAFKEDVVKAKLAHIPAANLEKAIATCKIIKGSTPCDTAFQITLCMWKQNVKKA